MKYYVDKGRPADLLCFFVPRLLPDSVNISRESVRVIAARGSRNPAYQGKHDLKKFGRSRFVRIIEGPA